MLALAISHQIFLTKEERIKLASGSPVEVTGVSVPVWFYRGTTSEPAGEVFCKYVITNELEDYPVTTLAQGYKFNLPQVPPDLEVPMRPEPADWDEMTNLEKEQWSRENPVPLSGFDLLDPQDGGVGQLRFKRYNRIVENGRRMNQIHNIEISTVESLVESLT